MTNIPAELKYTQNDEWLKIDGEEATTGVTDYAQAALSDIVYVELPEVGTTFKAGESYGTVESVKAASDMHLPIGGTITAINKELEEKPEQVNSDLYGGAWFVKFKPSSAAEADSLLDAAAYEKYCDERG